ncbi:MAG TPA: GNAT family N-acetyltransferase, partial [Chitinophagaceae bacterium]|nr:GNAT family N-acetyltransferase [Chitinophagaceae bacterium]
MEQVSIRAATMEDIPALLAFEQGVITAERPFDAGILPDPVHYYNLPEMIHAPHIALMVAVKEGMIVASGYARIEQARHFYHYQQHAYLGFMFTHPAYRGQGINQQIIAALKQWAIEQKVYDL